MMRFAQTYNKMTLGKFIPALFNKTTPTYIKLMIAFALSYTFLPFDLIPDLLGPLGFTDDVAVVGLLTTIAMKLLENYQAKHTPAPQVIEADIVSEA